MRLSPSRASQPQAVPPLFFWEVRFMAQPWKREPERKSDLWRILKYMNIVPAAYLISVCRSYFHFVYSVFQGQALLIFMVSNLLAFL